MLFRDTAVFALVMMLVGLLLMAALIGVSMIISLVAGRDLTQAERRRRNANATH